MIVHRLDGLESDNLLAFLALLGVLRALNQADAGLRPRVSWTLDEPPLRPRLHLAKEISEGELLDKIVTGIGALVQSHDFGKSKDLNYYASESRSVLEDVAKGASSAAPWKAILLATLMSDAVLKDKKSGESEQRVDPTPLCLLFGQGHQHFLERLAKVPAEKAPPKRGSGKKAVQITEQQCLDEALFHPWHRTDPTQSFRWDPNEDVRYAMMAGDPTDNAYKSGTQHGANRLAAIGLAALTLAPEVRAGRVRPAIIGGSRDRDSFSFAWPVWREPASLPAIVAMLAHPELRAAGALQYLGVENVMVAGRISVGKFMNFTRARPS